MSDQPVLTIAIPTYNRAEYLHLCLDRISQEIGTLNEVHCRSVRICISDNGSTDETPGVISHYLERLAGMIEAVRAEKNMGMDYNFTRCYELARTPYVWIVGDDDIILPGGLQRVLDALDKYDIDLLYLNNYWFEHDYQDAPNTKEMHGAVLCRSHLEFAKRTNVMLTYLSGLVVRSGIGADYRDRHTGSNIVQLSWVLPLLRDGKCFVVINDWVVAAKGSNSGGYGLVKVFGSNLMRITNEILKDKPNVARVIQNGAIVNFFPNFILEFRKGSSTFTDQEMACGLKEAFGSNWRYYIFLLPLVRLPLFAAGYFNVLLKVLRRLFRSVLV